MAHGIRRTKAVRIAAQLRAEIGSRAFGGSDLLPTEKALCARYGASRETVRKALCGLIAEGLLTRIPDRGVVVSRLGRAGASREAVQISVLTPYPYTICNYYYYAVLTGLVAGSHTTGSSLVFKARTTTTDVVSASEAGPTIVWPAEPDDLPVLYRMMAAQRPFMVMSASFSDNDLPCVDCDNVQGAGQAVDHLVSHGHQRIGLVARSHRLSMDHGHRIGAAKERLRAHGLPVHTDVVFLPEDAWSHAAYGQAFARWIQSGHFSAVFVMDLEVASAIYAACERERISIPEDLSLVAFDDSVLAEIYSPAITTIAQPLETIGRCAVERLADTQRNGKICRGTHRLETQLIDRDSVAKLNTAP